MSTFLLFLGGSFMLGILLRNKPWWMRHGLVLLITAYICYAYLLGGAQF